MTSPRLVLCAAVVWAGRELDQDAGRAVERELARARVPLNLEQVRESLLKQADAEEKSAEEWQRKTSMLGGPSSLLQDEPPRHMTPEEWFDKQQDDDNSEEEPTV